MTNDEKIFMLQEIAAVESRVNVRSKVWAMRRLIQLEKAHLQIKVGFNKLFKVVSEKSKDN